jgi:ribosomal protein L37AE/L43A
MLDGEICPCPRCDGELSAAGSAAAPFWECRGCGWFTADLAVTDLSRC